MMDKLLETVKEPKGFMKVLQFLFAILAFATTTSFSTEFSFHVAVAGCSGENISATVINNTAVYPFRLDHRALEVKLCKFPDVTKEFHFQGDTSSDAQFFVAMGVICMLVSVGCIAVYTVQGDNYPLTRAPVMDFCLHAVLVLLLFAAACAWADGARILKKDVDPKLWVKDICANMHNVTCRFDDATDSNGMFGKLNISLIFGFLNVFLWASNLWFLYKETPWFSRLPEAGLGPDHVGNI